MLHLQALKDLTTNLNDQSTNLTSQFHITIGVIYLNHFNVTPKNPSIVLTIAGTKIMFKISASIDLTDCNLKCFTTKPDLNAEKLNYWEKTIIFQKVWDMIPT